MSKLESETWDLVAIKDFISNSSDISSMQKKPLIEIVNSIAHSIDIFRYHGVIIHKEAEQLFKNGNIPELERFLMLGGQSQQQVSYEISRIACEANFIACVHTVRNMYDIFSQLINQLLLGSAITKNCNLHKVIDSLPASILKSELGNLKNSEGFNYISAFSNTVKHNALVRSTPRIAMSEDRFEPHINSFEYNGTQHHGRWMIDALKEVQNVLNSIIQCGRSFNEQLIGDNKNG